VRVTSGNLTNKSNPTLYIYNEAYFKGGQELFDYDNEVTIFYLNPGECVDNNSIVPLLL